MFLFTINNDYIESAPQVSLLIGISLAVIPSTIALILQLDSNKLFFQKDIYYFLKPITLEHFLLVEASLIGSAIVEELFYRFFSYNLMSLWTHAPLAVITSILFSFSHYLQKETRETFTLRSYIIIFLLGCSWFYSFFYTHNILFPILGHFLYNLPNIIIAFFKLYLPAKLNSNVEGSDPK
ncbi:CPBP family intramembrane metalloprotease [Paenibacillus tritici]|uniref:CPBP family intramembrane metalloprotease n=1 Tax=Paenibacillus tritici TaxID=1873425 RepID=A0ABX2DTR7_9BACL|nr:CPBP family intramembrane metalloprotease [Paenibacillus tritici]